MKEKTDITSRRYIVESAITFKALPVAQNFELEAIATKLTNELKQKYR